MDQSAGQLIICLSTTRFTLIIKILDGRRKSNLGCK